VHGWNVPVASAATTLHRLSPAARLLVTLACADVLTGTPVAHAEPLPSPGPPSSAPTRPSLAPEHLSLIFFSAGAFVGRTSERAYTYGGELSAWYQTDRFAPLLGLDGEVSDRTLSFEAQVAYALRAPITLGLSAGVVRLREPEKGTGFQATLWPMLVIPPSRPELPLPLFPYVRLEVFSGRQVVSAGFMLKVPVLWIPLAKKPRSRDAIPARPR
jgi:hypothetical protein